MFQCIGDIENVLPELIIGGSNESTAKLDCCKGVKAVKH
jgi:hypothetical protein